MPKTLWKSLFVAALLNSCATTIPDITVCAPVEGIAGVAALCRKTNSDRKWRLSIEEWFDFIYAQDERSDPKNPGKKLPAKGAALAVSSEDYMRNDLAIAQLCVTGKCSYEQENQLKAVTGRVQGLIQDTMPVINEGDK